MQNNYQYQGSFSEMDADIGWNDFDLRDYDAQIGRFVQQDPFGQFSSPYVGMGNDPVNLVDPTGGIGIPCPGTSQLAIFFMKAGEAIGKVTSAINGISNVVSIGVSVGKVGTEIFNNSVQTKIIDRQLVGNITLGVGEMEKGGNPLGLGEGTGNDDPLQYKVTMEDVVSELMKMKPGESKSGADVKHLNNKFDDLPVSLTKILKKVVRTNDGIRVYFTWIGRTILTAVPGTPDIEDGALIQITRVSWPNDSYGVWHLFSADIKNIKYNYGGSNIRKGNLNIYLHNNAYTDKIAQGNPKVWAIMKGHWYSP